MQVKPNPDLTKHYRAIDGIPVPSRRGVRDAQGNFQFSEPERAIRTDVEEILSMNDGEFKEWYTSRREATLRILADYEIFSTIPALGYGRESQRLTVAEARTGMVDHIKTLREGLKHLEIIRKVREDSRS